MSTQDPPKGPTHSKPVCATLLSKANSNPWNAMNLHSATIDAQTILDITGIYGETHPRFSCEHLPHFLINSHQWSNLLGKGDTRERNETKFSHSQLPTAQVASSQDTDYRGWHCKLLSCGKVCICQMEVERRIQQGCPCNSCPKWGGLQSSRMKFQFACRYAHTWRQVYTDSCIGTTDCDT